MIVERMSKRGRRQERSKLKKFAACKSNSNFELTILVDYINLFGRFNGFDRLGQLLPTTVNLLDTFLISVTAFASPTVKQLMAMKEGGEAMRSAFAESLEKCLFLLEQQLENKSSNGDQSQSLIVDDKFDLFIEASHYLLPFLSTDASPAPIKRRVDAVELQMLYRLITSSKSDQRVDGMNKLIHRLSSYQNNDVDDARGDLLGLGETLVWMDDAKLIECMLDYDTDDPDHVSRIEDVARQLIKHSALTTDQLNSIWKAQMDQSWVVKELILRMVGRLSLLMSDEMLEELFDKINLAWIASSEVGRDQLLHGLLIPLSELDSEGKIVPRLLKLMWKMAVENDNLTDEVRKASGDALVKVLMRTCSNKLNAEAESWVKMLVADADKPYQMSMLLHLCFLLDENNQRELVEPVDMVASINNKLDAFQTIANHLMMTRSELTKTILTPSQSNNTDTNSNSMSIDVDESDKEEEVDEGVANGDKDEERVYNRRLASLCNNNNENASDFIFALLERQSQDWSSTRSNGQQSRAILTRQALDQLRALSLLADKGNVSQHVAPTLPRLWNHFCASDNIQTKIDQDEETSEEQRRCLAEALLILFAYLPNACFARDDRLTFLSQRMGELDSKLITMGSLILHRSYFINVTQSSRLLDDNRRQFITQGMTSLWRLILGVPADNAECLVDGCIELFLRLLINSDLKLDGRMEVGSDIQMPPPPPPRDFSATTNTWPVMNDATYQFLCTCFNRAVELTNQETAYLDKQSNTGVLNVSSKSSIATIERLLRIVCFITQKVPNCLPRLYYSLGRRGLMHSATPYTEIVQLNYRRVDHERLQFELEKDGVIIVDGFQFCLNDNRPAVKTGKMCAKRIQLFAASKLVGTFKLPVRLDSNVAALRACVDALVNWPETGFLCQQPRIFLYKGMPSCDGVECNDHDDDDPEWIELDEQQGQACLFPLAYANRWKGHWMPGALQKLMTDWQCRSECRDDFGCPKIDVFVISGDAGDGDNNKNFEAVAEPITTMHPNSNESASSLDVVESSTSPSTNVIQIISSSDSGAPSSGDRNGLDRMQVSSGDSPIPTDSSSSSSSSDDIDHVDDHRSIFPYSIKSKHLEHFNAWLRNSSHFIDPITTIESDGCMEISSDCDRILAENDHYEHVKMLLHVQRLGITYNRSYLLAYANKLLLDSPPCPKMEEEIRSQLSECLPVTFPAVPHSFFAQAPIYKALSKTELGNLLTQPIIDQPSLLVNLAYALRLIRAMCIPSSSVEVIFEKEPSSSGALTCHLRNGQIIDVDRESLNSSFFTLQLLAAGFLQAALTSPLLVNASSNSHSNNQAVQLMLDQCRNELVQLIHLLLATLIVAAGEKGDNAAVSQWTVSIGRALASAGRSQILFLPDLGQTLIKTGLDLAKLASANKISLDSIITSSNWTEDHRGLVKLTDGLFAFIHQQSNAFTEEKDVGCHGHHGHPIAYDSSARRYPFATIVCPFRQCLSVLENSSTPSYPSTSDEVKMLKNWRNYSFDRDKQRELLRLLSTHRGLFSALASLTWLCRGFIRSDHRLAIANDLELLIQSCLGLPLPPLRHLLSSYLAYATLTLVGNRFPLIVRKKSALTPTPTLSQPIAFAGIVGKLLGEISNKTDGQLPLPSSITSIRTACRLIDHCMRKKIYLPEFVDWIGVQLISLKDLLEKRKVQRFSEALVDRDENKEHQEIEFSLRCLALTHLVKLAKSTTPSTAEWLSIETEQGSGGKLMDDFKVCVQALVLELYPFFVPRIPGSNQSEVRIDKEVAILGGFVAESISFLLEILCSVDRCMVEFIAGSLFPETNYPMADQFRSIDWEFSPSPLSEPVVDDSNRRLVGLYNGGATCYMNAILQQLFAIKPLREAILSIGRGRSKQGTDSSVIDNAASRTAEQNRQVQLLMALRKLFTHLQHSQMPAYRPSSLWLHFRFYGESVRVQEQHDATEFLQVLTSEIDDALHLCKQPKIIESLIGGVFADQKICIGCPHRYSRDEVFTTFDVDIGQHRNLQDSLDVFIKGDLLDGDNAYYCEKCDRKVDALKKTCVKQLPKLLVIQLKRFVFDCQRGIPIKDNSYFAFPYNLDMSPYMLKESVVVDNLVTNGDGDDDVTFNSSNGAASVNRSAASTSYRLRGVVVHSGQAAGGHYYSHIRDTNLSDSANGEGDQDLTASQWHLFDDTMISSIPFQSEEDFGELWFGGAGGPTAAFNTAGGRTFSAYLLFYERNDFFSSLNNRDQKDKSSVDPKTSQKMNAEELAALELSTRFSPHFHDFILSLCQDGAKYCNEVRLLAGLLLVELSLMCLSDMCTIRPIIAQSRGLDFHSSTLSCSGLSVPANYSPSSSGNSSEHKPVSSYSNRLANSWSHCNSPNLADQLIQLALCSLESELAKACFIDDSRDDGSSSPPPVNDSSTGKLPSFGALVQLLAAFRVYTKRSPGAGSKHLIAIGVLERLTRLVRDYMIFSETIEFSRKITLQVSQPDSCLPLDRLLVDAPSTDGLNEGDADALAHAMSNVSLTWSKLLECQNGLFDACREAIAMTGGGLKRARLASVYSGRLLFVMLICFELIADLVKHLDMGDSSLTHENDEKVTNEAKRIKPSNELVVLLTTDLWTSLALARFLSRWDVVRNRTGTEIILRLGVSMCTDNLKLSQMTIDKALETTYMISCDIGCTLLINQLLIEDSVKFDRLQHAISQLSQFDTSLSFPTTLALFRLLLDHVILGDQALESYLCSDDKIKSFVVEMADTIYRLIKNGSISDLSTPTIVVLDDRTKLDVKELPFRAKCRQLYRALKCANRRQKAWKIFVKQNWAKKMPLTDADFTDDSSPLLKELLSSPTTKTVQKTNEVEAPVDPRPISNGTSAVANNGLIEAGSSSTTDLEEHRLDFLQTTHSDIEEPD